MRRIVSLGLVPVVSLAFASLPAFVLAEEAPATAPVEAPPAAPATVINATMAKKGRVHYGPSLQSKDAAVLETGTPVEVLGVAKGLPDWYAVRFPKQGKMWVHLKNLEPIDDGKSFRVTADRTRARDDATAGAGVIAELAKGEVIETKGTKVGEWQPVYASSAVAYIHKSVLNLPAGVAPAATQAQAAPTIDPQEASWLEAKAIYARYKAVLDANNYDTAVKLDWTSLSSELDLVARKHGSVHVRLDAQRLKDGIAKVVAAAEKLQREGQIAPTREIPGEPPIVVPKPETPAAPAPAPVATTTPATPVAPPTAPEPVKPATPETPAKPPTAPPAGAAGEEFKAAVATTPKAQVADFAATGMLVERPFPKVGTTHVLIDGDDKVLAFLKVKPGSNVQFSEWIWSNVGVKGEVQDVDPALHGLSGKIPLVMVEDVFKIR